MPKWKAQSYGKVAEYVACDPHSNLTVVQDR